MRSPECRAALVKNNLVEASQNRGENPDEHRLIHLIMFYVSLLYSHRDEDNS